MPRVSIITPCWNSERFLPAVYAALAAQTFADWEWIIADDASTDGGLKLLREVAERDARVRPLALEHRGQPAAMRNEGMRQARGEFFAFLDSDDIWLPEKLELQIATLAADPALGAAYCWVEEFWDEAAGITTPAPTIWPRRELPRDAFAALVEFGGIISTSGLVIRRAVWDRVGGFDEAPELRVGDDTEFILRIAKNFPIARTPGVLVRYRLHANNITRNVPFSGTQAIMERLVARGDLKGRVRDVFLSGFYLSRAEKGLREGAWSAARADFLRSVWYRPLMMKRWLGVLSVALPGPIFLKLYSGLKQFQVRLQGKRAAPHPFALKRGKN